MRFFSPLAPAKKENQIEQNGVRISVISDRIVRVEKGEFCDNQTQTVVCRDFANPMFSTTIEGNKVSIVTNSAIFLIDTNTLKVLVKLDKNCKGGIAPNKKDNLGGTARTLDGTFGVLGGWKGKEKKDHFFFGHIRKGIFSSSGVSEIDDSASCLLEGDCVKQRKQGAIDKYILAFGDDYLGGLKEFYSLCGATPLLPKYALGNWWSRYYAYTQEEYLELMDKFEEKKIPLSVATIDMDWHIVKNVPEDVPKLTFQGAGWTGYTFEKELFPDYKAFLRNLKERNLAVTMNLHPKDGIRYFECMYPQMAEACGIDPSTKQPVEFDLTDKKFRDAYFDIVHHPYEEDGVDFWWIDWQQGTKSKMVGLDPLWLLNHYHFVDNCRDNKRGLILSRYAGLGSHRYPLGFSGDTIVCWKSLKFQPYFTSLASNAGYTWWSHDIGGHLFNRGQKEIYLRWLQYGVFSPINRLHSSKVGVSKEPWKYGEMEELAIKFLQLRHRLLPYLYTSNVLTHEQGIPLISPMYYYSKERNARAKKYRNQYYFGEQMLVCPVTKKSKDGVTTMKIWLPQGEWTDFFTAKKYTGGEHTIAVSLDRYPVFVKSGSVVPLLKEREGNLQQFDELDVQIYAGNGTYTLWDEQGSIEFEQKLCGDELTLAISPKDSKTSNLTLHFVNCKGEPSIDKNKIVVHVAAEGEGDCAKVDVEVASLAE